MLSLILVASLQIQVPQPTGFVNDFASVIDPATEGQMLVIINEVRRKSGGEIVVVTMTDLQGREPLEMAVQIGREWGVGATGGAGDRARNAGVVMLLRPGQRPGDGRSRLQIAAGTGAEGFVTDARAGQIRDAVGRAAVERGNFGAGLLVGVQLLAAAFAEEFNFELSGQAAPPMQLVPRSGRGPRLQGLLALALFFFLFLMPLLSRRGRMRGRGYHGSGMGWLLLAMLAGGGRGGGGFGGGGFGGGGFGGGGFGGFGGGGGCGGGGAGGSF